MADDNIILDTVYLVGAGAVENAWEPVFDALEEFGLASGGNTGVGRGEGAEARANTFFSLEAALLRHAHSEGFPPDERARAIERHKQVKEYLARHLGDVPNSRRLRLRPRLREMIRQSQREERRFAFLTTNWDAALDGELERTLGVAQVAHLHGSTVLPDFMLLPTETVHDIHHSAEQRGWYKDNFMVFWKAFNRAKRIVIFGQGMAPQDSDLGLTFWLGLNDPAPGAGGPIEVHALENDVGTVADRVRVLVAAATKEARRTWSVKECHEDGSPLEP